MTEPDAIAVQLTRDLLAWYLTTLRGVSARNTENERLAATRDERVARLLAIIPEASIPPPPHWRGAVTVDASWRDPSWQDNPTWLAATIHVGLTRTDMNITDCDETLTIRVAEAIADHYRRHHPPDPEAAVEQDPVPAPGTEADAPVGGGS